jgi:Protein of unknown function (DUF3892)
MAFKVEISCITKANRTDPHERISYVGGVNDNNSRWILSLDQAIAGIETDKYTFWTRGGGRIADVIIATHNGNKYLKTVADGIQPDKPSEASRVPIIDAYGDFALAQFKTHASAYLAA